MTDDRPAAAGVGFSALLRTSSFRLALGFLLLFCVATGGLLGLTWRVTVDLVDRQIDQTLAAEVEGLADIYRRLGTSGVVDAVRDRVRSPGGAGLYLVTAANGRPLAGNLSGWPPDLAAADGQVTFRFADPDRADIGSIAARGRIFALPGALRLLVARDLADRDRFSEQLGRVVLGGMAATLLVGLIGAGWIARRTQARIGRLTDTLDRIERGDFQARLSTGSGRDEVDRLAEATNAALDRIETLMAGLKQLSNTLAHELSTPLSRLRNRLERVLADPGRGEADLTVALGEADRLLTGLRGLLDIAEAEAGLLDHARVPVDLAALATDLADLYAPAIEEAGLSLATDIRGPVAIAGHPALLSRAVANLLDNALKYTPAGGTIHLDAGTGPTAGWIAVRDTGPGIAAADRDRVLRPFARAVGPASPGGSGLGLSLVHAVARAHGARLDLGDNDPGLSVTLTVPTGPGRPRNTSAGKG